MKKQFPFARVIIVLLLASTAAYAQDGFSAANATTTLPEATPYPQDELAPATATRAEAKVVEPPKKLPFRINQDIQLNYSYVGESKTKNGDTSLGDGMEKQSFKFGYNIAVPVSDQWMLLGTVGYGRLDFGEIPGVLLPQNLESSSVGVGASYKLDSEWKLFVKATSQIQQVDGETPELFMNGIMGANYRWNPNLSLTFGLAIAPDNEMPAFPVFGVEWKFAEKWTLQAGVPRTRVTYALNEKLDLWSGFSVDGGTYKTGDHYGDGAGRADLNNRKISYTEIKGGVGADYKILPNLTLTGEVGSAFYREFEYKDGDKIKADPALMAEIGVKVNF